MRRLSMFVALLATVTFAAASAAPAQNGGLPASFFGVIPVQPLQMSEFQRMSDAKLGTLRIPVIWRQIEPNQDDGYDFSGLDQNVAFAAQVGVDVLPFIYSSPKWAVGGCSTAIKCQNVPPTDSQQATEAWKDLLRDLVGRYGPNGTFWSDTTDAYDPPYHPITRWQIWNEPSSPTYWNKPSASKYAQLVQISHDTITAEDPNAEILLAGLFGTPQGQGKSKNVMWKYLGRFYDSVGASDSFDAVALHPYSPDVKGLRFQLNKARHILDQHGDQEKEILVTEIGWGSARPHGDKPLIKGRKGQAKLLRKSYNFLLHNRSHYNIGSIIWYSWADPESKIKGCDFCGSAGLFTFQGKPKPAWNELVKITGGTP